MIFFILGVKSLISFSFGLSSFLSTCHLEIIYIIYGYYQYLEINKENHAKNNNHAYSWDYPLYYDGL